MSAINENFDALLAFAESVLKTEIPRPGSLSWSSQLLDGQLSGTENKVEKEQKRLVVKQEKKKPTGKEEKKQRVQKDEKKQAVKATGKKQSGRKKEKNKVKETRVGKKKQAPAKKVKLESEGEETGHESASDEEKQEDTQVDSDGKDEVDSDGEDKKRRKQKAKMGIVEDCHYKEMGEGSRIHEDTRMRFDADWV